MADVPEKYKFCNTIYKAIPPELYQSEMRLYLKWLDKWTQNNGRINGNSPWEWKDGNWYIIAKSPFHTSDLKDIWMRVLADENIEIIFDVDIDSKNTLYYYLDGVPMLAGNSIVDLWLNPEFKPYRRYACWNKNRARSTSKQANCQYFSATRWKQRMNG